MGLDSLGGAGLAVLGNGHQAKTLASNPRGRACRRVSFVQTSAADEKLKVPLVITHRHPDWV